MGLIVVVVVGVGIAVVVGTVSLGPTFSCSYSWARLHSPSDPSPSLIVL